MDLQDLLGGESTLMGVIGEHLVDKGLGVRWRYDDPWDVDDEISVWGFTVTKKTPKGCWIDFHTIGKFILDGHGRRYAYPTKQEALESYIIRKQRQIQHAATTHDKATVLLAKAKAMSA